MWNVLPEFDGNTKEELDAHLTSNHNGAREEVPITGNCVLTEFFCKLCEFTAESNDDLGEHVLKKHTTWFNCVQCDFKTRVKSEMENQQILSTCPACAPGIGI